MTRRIPNNKKIIIKNGGEDAERIEAAEKIKAVRTLLKSESFVLFYRGVNAESGKNGSGCISALSNDVDEHLFPDLVKEFLLSTKESFSKIRELEQNERDSTD